MYDSLAKVLVEMLRGRWQQGDSASVATVVKSAMRGVGPSITSGADL